MGICLNMIVKNESRNLDRLFQSLQGWIDFYVIADTGSTDDTVERIEALGRQWNISGLVVSHPWVDFAHNRNRAMEAAVQARQQGLHRCDWLLIIDADETLSVEDSQWKKRLIPGTSYTVYKQAGGLAYRHLFLPNIDACSWTWQGMIHNYLLPDLTPPPSIEPITGVSIIYHEMQGAKSMAFANAREKYQHDLDLMLQELADRQPNRGNAHRFFQVGYLYQALEDPRTAASWYECVWACPEVSVDIRYAAAIMSGKQWYLAGDPVSSSRCLQQARELAPERPDYYFYQAMAESKAGKVLEALDLLDAAAARTRQQPDYWMVEFPLYSWRIDFERCLLYIRIGEHKKAVDLVDVLLQRTDLPSAERSLLQQMKQRLVSTDKPPLSPSHQPDDLES